MKVVKRNHLLDYNVTNVRVRSVVRMDLFANFSFFVFFLHAFLKFFRVFFFSSSFVVRLRIYVLYVGYGNTFTYYSFFTYNIIVPQSTYMDWHMGFVLMLSVKMYKQIVLFPVTADGNIILHTNIHFLNPTRCFVPELFLVVYVQGRWCIFRLRFFALSRTTHRWDKGGQSVTLQ